MTKTITINGIEFEYHKKHFTNDELSDIAYSTKANIFRFYNRPSMEKMNIWESWINWSYELHNLFYFGISSANTFTFTIKGILEDNVDEKTGELYNIVLVITRDHNKAYRVI